MVGISMAGIEPGPAHQSVMAMYLQPLCLALVSSFFIENQKPRQLKSQIHFSFHRSLVASTCPRFLLELVELGATIT
jgi:hypothetical protein